MLELSERKYYYCRAIIAAAAVLFIYYPIGVQKPGPSYSPAIVVYTT